MTIALYGYQYSVYSWIARLTLAEKGVRHDWIEINPFAPDLPLDYASVHPFKRVPAFVHDGFRLYETTAITRYIDEAFDGPALQLSDPRQRARCNQIVAVIDSYAYWPLIRQVFSHRVFRPCFGLPSDAGEIRNGLDAAPAILQALERSVADADYLCGAEISLADLHLAPMLGYFTMAAEGAALLRQYPRLGAWWVTLSARGTVRATTPALPPPP